jgi:uncharacterized protein YkwD
MRMRSRIILVLIIAAAGAGYYYRDQLSELYKGVSSQVTEEVSKLKEIEGKIFAPPPLRGPTAEVASNLTVSGTIIETNRQRAANGGLPALSFNSQLAAAAQVKADDLFARQYFEHESPTGEGPGDLAANAGYEYIIVGENLAMGNFENDAVLVQAWMDSPGHRANILNTQYTEIGVAVKRGVYEGYNVWMAVQEFGRPLSDCPQVSVSLKNQIEANNDQLEQMQIELQAKKQEIDSTRPKRGDEYNQGVEEYNTLVEQYNELLIETKSQVETYNGQVEGFNECVG